MYGNDPFQETENFLMQIESFQSESYFLENYPSMSYNQKQQIKNILSTALNSAYEMQGLLTRSGLRTSRAILLGERYDSAISHIRKLIKITER